MIFGVFALCAAKNVDQIGFYEQKAKTEDYLAIDLTNDVSAIVQIRDSSLNIISVNESGTAFGHVFSSESHGVKCVGSSANITTEGSMDVWVIPRDLCNGPVLSYSTSSFISDVFTSESTTENFCMFFPNQGTAHFYARIISKSADSLRKFTLFRKDMTFISTDELHDNGQPEGRHSAQRH